MQQHDNLEDYDLIPTGDGRETYLLTTPFGVIRVSDSGREITFRLHGDVRTSLHHKALFNYCHRLVTQGIDRFNVSHIQLPGLDRSIDLKRGGARIDLVYYRKGKMHEVELKTAREIGANDHAIQIRELAAHCHRLTLVVPTKDIPEMWQVLALLKLEKAIDVEPYDSERMPLEIQDRTGTEFQRQEGFQPPAQEGKH